MKIGDLVQLNPVYFDLFDETYGVIIDSDKMEDKGTIIMFRVRWFDDSHGEIEGWYDQNELEVANESG